MHKLLMFVAESRKAVVGLLMAFVTASFAARGIALPVEVEAALGGLITAVMVWLTPNGEA
jgi:Na+/phosphate symporter